MPRITEIELLFRVRQPVLSIRTKTTVDTLPILINNHFDALDKRLKELGEIPTDYPFVTYHNMDIRDLDIETGIAVAHKLPGKGDIQADILPSCKIVTCMFRGWYGDIEPVYEEMKLWLRNRGLNFTGSACEYYYNLPELFPQEDLLTKIVIPIN